jgi:hypothetical protein
MALLAEQKVYVKLSGLYRFSTMPDLEDYIREILRVAPTQVVWASDWPHSGGMEANPGGDRTKVQEYRKVNIPSFVLDCKGGVMVMKSWLGKFGWRIRDGCSNTVGRIRNLSM